MTDTTSRSSEELAQAWVRALSDVDAFPDLCAPQCKVWHSTDNKWVTVPEAVQAVHDSGGLPPMRDQVYTLTAEGFFVQYSATFHGSEMHNCILVKVHDGAAVRVEEYVGVEMAVQPSSA